MTTMAKAGVWGAAVMSLGLLAGCGGGAESSSAPGATAVQAPPAKAPAALRVEAQQTFAARCAVCHGPAGRGDGPGSPGLTPAPRNYHDPAWQAGVTDTQIEQTIVYGGAAVGKSPAMVANPDLGNRPELVVALRELIREFGKQQ
jgi:mono/diheme cytochrome c family protein